MAACFGRWKHRSLRSISSSSSSNLKDASRRAGTAGAGGDSAVRLAVIQARMQQKLCGSSLLANRVALAEGQRGRDPVSRLFTTPDIRQRTNSSGEKGMLMTSREKRLEASNSDMNSPIRSDRVAASVSASASTRRSASSFPSSSSPLLLLRSQGEAFADLE